MKPYVLALALAWAAVIAGSASAQAPACAGDCDEDGVVRIHELIRLVNAALELRFPCLIELCPPPDPCLGADANGDGMIAVNELTQAINRITDAVGNGMTGCP
ncbi:MAG TPA: hypothetical protein VL049_08875 [Candidatus Dormibacteraeota bacterium]|nr:hypothetical protein [Candidatus Dormibacteraeota bacterium]